MLRLVLCSILTLLPAALKAQEFSTAAMRSLTLSEAYAMALSRSESLAAGKEGIKQLEAAERAINAGFRPSFDLNAAYYKEQPTPAVTRAWFSGRYVFFSGMRDYIGLKAAAARTKASTLDLQRAEKLLYLDTARACLDLYEAQREALIRREQLQVTGRRITELQARVNLGRSRRSEETAAKTQLAQDKAAYLAALSAERAAQQVLLFLTGLDEDLAPEAPPLRDAAPLETYLKTALRRQDIEARRSGVEQYSYLLQVQDRNLWPEASVYADLYPVRRPVPSEPNRWDAGAQLRVPLYNGGQSDAQRQAAYAARRGAELDLEGATRRALSEVRAAYDELKYAALQTASLEEALALASDNALLQQEDYKLSLVTNLDVLSALNTVQQTRLALAQARTRQLWALLKLENAAGADPK